MTNINLNANPITPEELINDIKISSNGLVLYNFNSFLRKVSPEIGISVNDILEVFGAKEGKYPSDKVEQAVKYSLLSDEEKNGYLTEQKELFEEILKYKRDGMQRLIQSPFKIINALIPNGIENNQPVGLFNDLMDLLALATGKDKSRIFLSDFDIWIEIFTRIIFKKQGEANKSFLIMSGIKQTHRKYPFTEFYEKRKLSYEEQLINELVNDPLDIFDLTWLEINLFSLLRDNNYSQEWIEKTSLEKLLSIFFILREKSMIESAKEWFYSELSDIKTKSEQVTGDSKEKKELLAILIDRANLEREKFGITLKEFRKKNNER